MTDGALPPFAQSITENWVAMDHFTNRHHAIRRFAEYLNIDPAPETTLFFHGQGGNGKSLLTRFLNLYCTKRLPTAKWNEAALKTDDAFTRYLAQSDPGYTIPSARIDLRDGVETVLEQLLSLSHQLAPSGIRFPLFTYACVQYWNATRQLTPDLIRSNFPNEELDFAVALASDLTSLVPGASAAVAFFNVVKKRLGPRFDDYSSRRKLGAENVETIGRWEAAEIYQKLPIIFAEDLNAAMQASDAPQRVALIIDTYERFWGAPRNVVPSEHPERDSWIRLLLTTLDRSLGVVVAIAGREAPWWDKLPRRQRIAVEAIVIGEFRDTDARAYLERLPNHDPAVRDRLIELARVGRDRVHPLSLGLAADIAILGLRNGEDVTSNLRESSEDVEEMIDYLLRYLLVYCDDPTRHAIRALAACRRFNFEIYCHLGNTNGFDAEARFAALTQLSFIHASVGQAGKDAHWFMMHELLRRLIRLDAHGEIRRANITMEAFHRSRDDDESVVEAIYHATQLDERRGLDIWSSTFDAALDRSRYDLCRALINLLPDIQLSEGVRKATIYRQTATFEALLTQFAEAEAEFLAAINEYASIPGDSTTTVLIGHGQALTEYGDLLARLGRYERAESLYQQSFDHFTAALTREPANVDAHRMKSHGLHLRAKLLAKQGFFSDAFEGYQRCLDSHDSALEHAPTNLALHISKAHTLRSRAEMLAKFGSYDDALADHNESLRLLNSVLDRDPVSVEAIRHKSRALQARTDLLIKLGRNAQALDSCNQSLVTCEASLALSPLDPTTLNNRARALRAKADVLAKLGRGDEALVSCDDCLATYERSLTVAPASPATLNNKAFALRVRADLLASLDRVADALDACEQSIRTYDEALVHSPSDPLTHNNKARSLRTKAEVFAKLGLHADSLRGHDQSLDVIAIALKYRPDDVNARSYEASAHRGRAHALSTLNRTDEARSAYGQSIASYESALDLAPNHLMALTGKAETHLGYHQLVDVDAGREHVQAASRLLQQAREIAPDNDAIQLQLERTRHLLQHCDDETEVN